jgi:hypothetical protein
LQTTDPKNHYPIAISRYSDNDTMHANVSRHHLHWTGLLLLATAAVVSGGCAQAYHFMHYNPVAEAIHDHHKSYYHSPKTGRIIPKEHHQPCVVELPCFGYEPTCWHRWPAECGKCPLDGEVIASGTAPYHGQEVIVREEVIGSGTPTQAEPLEQPAPVQSDLPTNPAEIDTDPMPLDDASIDESPVPDLDPLDGIDSAEVQPQEPALPKQAADLPNEFADTMTVKAPETVAKEVEVADKVEVSEEVDVAEAPIVAPAIPDFEDMQDFAGLEKDDADWMEPNQGDNLDRAFEPRLPISSIPIQRIAPLPGFDPQVVEVKEPAKAETPNDATTIARTDASSNRNSSAPPSSRRTVAQEATPDTTPSEIVATMPAARFDAKLHEQDAHVEELATKQPVEDRIMREVATVVSKPLPRFSITPVLPPPQQTAAAPIQLKTAPAVSVRFVSEQTREPSAEVVDRSNNSSLRFRR